MTAAQSQAPKCGRCHRPVKGHATINAHPYCHDPAGVRPTCYDLAMWDKRLTRHPPTERQPA